MFSEPCEICNGRGVKVRMDAPGVKHQNAKPARESQPAEAPKAKPADEAKAQSRQQAAAKAEPELIATAAQSDAAPAFAPRGEQPEAPAKPVGRRNRKAASRPAGPPS